MADTANSVGSGKVGSNPKIASTSLDYETHDTKRDIELHIPTKKYRKYIANARMQANLSHN
jgi:hypothetical protein